PERATPATDALSLHDALPIFRAVYTRRGIAPCILYPTGFPGNAQCPDHQTDPDTGGVAAAANRNTRSTIHLQKAAQSRRCNSLQDRKSTRLNSSHVSISYAVF